MQRTLFSSKKIFSLADTLILLIVGTLIYGVASMSQQWRAEFHPLTTISLSPWVLPKYMLLSGIRGLVAYLISLSFTLVVGYTAAKSRPAERIILPLLDILQSIPVLGFLPGLVLGLTALFPRTNTGLELAAVIMIFTGQAWNMTFSYYSSLKSVPTDFKEAATVMGLSWRQRLLRVELPFSAVNLAWNSLMSMAGGWFFLSACEAITLGDHEFRLPGIGSYMAQAVSEGDVQAMVLGVLAMVILIVVMDIVIWRPILAWVQRFRLEDLPGAAPEEPLMQVVLRESRILRWVKVIFHRFEIHRRARQARHAKLVDPPSSFAELPLEELIPSTRIRVWVQGKRNRLGRSRWILLGVKLLLWAAVVAVIGWTLIRLGEVLLSLRATEWFILGRDTFWTFCRVLICLILGTLWAVPAGIWIGMSPRRVRIFQPIIQVLASFPAPMLYPIVLAVLFRFKIGFDWAPMFLMLLGVQWYILFNVLAGALRIPQELGDALLLMETSRWERWRTLYLPSVFPSLVTGWVTAAGGAWNASVVAEYLPYRGQVLKTGGVGATISMAVANQDLRLLAASLTIMVLVVVFFNRSVWAKIYQLAQTRYRLDL